MSKYIIHFYNIWEEWASSYDCFSYSDILNECYENPYMEVICRGNYTWVYISEEYYDQEKEE